MCTCKFSFVIYKKYVIHGWYKIFTLLEKFDLSHVRAQAGYGKLTLYSVAVCRIWGS